MRSAASLEMTAHRLERYAGRVGVYYGMARVQFPPSNGLADRLATTAYPSFTVPFHKQLKGRDNSRACDGVALHVPYWQLSGIMAQTHQATESST